MDEDEINALHERANTIIARHLNAKTCIVCGQEITDDQEIISSDWGYFWHGPPKKCVEGHEELPFYQQ